MKKYVFFTADIHSVGGMQNYLSGKVKFLKEDNWLIYIFFAGKNSGECAFPILSHYTSGGLEALKVFPNQLTSSELNSIVSTMKKIISYDKNDEVFIESHYDKTAVWGEIFAAIVKGKHVCLNCNEVFRGKHKYYEDYIDLFWFKYQRNELAGISDKSLKMLFSGYKDIKEDKNRVFSAAPDDSVQDVDREELNLIGKFHFNIGYIGRTEKECFQHISQGICNFAKYYPQFDMQYVIVGDLDKHMSVWIDKLFRETKNIFVTKTGSMIPLPKKLFKKIDVVLAGSGCAIISAEEGVPTILADAENNMSNGFLGYDTNDFLFSDNNTKQTTFEKSLADWFIYNKYESMSPQLPKREKPNYYYEKHFSYFKNDTVSQEYFPLERLIVPKRLLSIGSIRYHILCLLQN